MRTSAITTGTYTYIHTSVYIFSRIKPFWAFVAKPSNEVLRVPEKYTGRKKSRQRSWSHDVPALTPPPLRAHAFLEGDQDVPCWISAGASARSNPGAAAGLHGSFGSRHSRHAALRDAAYADALHADRGERYDSVVVYHSKRGGGGVGGDANVFIIGYFIASPLFCAIGVLFFIKNKIIRKKENPPSSVEFPAGFLPCWLEMVYAMRIVRTLAVLQQLWTIVQKCPSRLLRLSGYCTVIFQQRCVWAKW